MQKEDCIFCKIVAGEIPSTKIYEDEKCYAFEDLEPIAPVHILLIPKEHYDNIGDNVSSELLGYLLTKAHEIAEMKGIKDSGYRVITNTGNDAGQSVKHLHFHIVGGKQLRWEA